MTNSTIGDFSLLPAFGEKVDILLDEISLAVKWNRPGFVLAVTQSVYVELEVEEVLKSQAGGLQPGVVHMSFDRDPSSADLNYFQTEIHEVSDCILSVDAACQDADVQAGFLAVVAGNLGTLRQNNVQLILWLREADMRNLAMQFPELWYGRSFSLHFDEPREEDSPLLSELESAWQADSVSETASEPDDEFGVREAANPDDEHEKQGRALLELGILKWRKGQYDASLDLLNQALLHSYEVQDEGFEAQCLNAIGLVYARVSRFEDAIAAYKKAVQIAPNQLHVWNNLGSLCLKLGRKDEALAVFLRAAEGNPGDAVAWNGIGQVYHVMGFADSAISAFEKSANLAPAFSEPWCWMGEVYAAQGRYEEAIRSYQKAIQVNPNLLSQSVRLARTLFKSGRLEDARKLYRRILKQDPQNSEVWGELGLVYLNLSDDRTAEETFRRSIQCDPMNGKPYGSLGLLYVKQGKLEDGIRLFLKAIELLPNGRIKADVLNNLGDAHRHQGNYAEAILSYEKADAQFSDMPGAPVSETASLSPEPLRPAPEVSTREQGLSAPNDDDAAGLPSKRQDADEEHDPAVVQPPSWIVKKQLKKKGTPASSDGSQALMSNETYGDDEMIKAFFAKLMRPKVYVAPEMHFARKKSEAIVPMMDNPEVWTERGNHFFAKGEMDKAVAAYERAIEMNGDFGWAYCNMALVFFLQGKYIDAAAFYTRASDLLELNSEKAICWNGLGNVYRRMGNYEKAMDAFQKATALDPLTSGIRDGADAVHASSNVKKAKIRNELGELFTRSGETEDALIAFQSAVEMDPSNPEYLNNLAGLMVTMAKYRDAIETYKRCLELPGDDKSRAAIWNRIGNAYRKMKNYDSAIQAYQKAVVLADEKVDLLTRARFSLLSNS